MTKKKRKNTVIVQLTPVQRLCLWSSLDLLVYIHESVRPNIDFSTVEQLWDIFDQLDGDSRILGIEFYPREHRICNVALKFACLYLDGQYSNFRTPIIPKVDQELMENADVIRDLYSLFGGY